jgi:putative FmdB family regulatory protein
MPIYVYRCPLGHENELLQSIGADAPKRCERCGQGPLTRILSPVTTRFHGKGFYTTDYKPHTKQ